MKGSGGTDGGVPMFFIGLGLTALAGYLFFDSVRVTTGGGWITGLLRGGGGGGIWNTTSMGLIFVPFLLGVIALFYDAKLKWAWWLMNIGLAIIVIEVLSRLRFLMNTKLSHLLGMMILFAAGIGLMLRSYRPQPATSGKDEDDVPK
jgi:hypothetical protein